MSFARLFVACAVIVGALGINTWDVQRGEDLWQRLDLGMDDEWMLFKKTYNKTYQHITEELSRRIYWEDNRNYIKEHNDRFDRGEFTYYLGENEYSDLAEDEYEKQFLRGLIIPDLSEEEYPEPLTEPDPEAPSSIDWREKNKVTDVKNQGNCGSCWAFSALGAMESLVMKKKNTQTAENFSEQNLVDCAYTSYGNYACRGGWMNNAYKYIQRSGGINSEKCYPYTARKGYCRFKSNCVAARVSGYKNCGKSEHSVASDVAKVGPVAIAADVSGRAFGSYRGGVYKSSSCNPQYPNHAMVAVGYGDSKYGRYWVIKNSWGKSWGSSGYIYMCKNCNNDCGIKSFASYPNV